MKKSTEFSRIADARQKRFFDSPFASLVSGITRDSMYYEVIRPAEQRLIAIKAGGLSLRRASVCRGGDFIPSGEGQRYTIFVNREPNVNANGEMVSVVTSDDVVRMVVNAYFDDAQDVELFNFPTAQSGHLVRTHTSELGDLNHDYKAVHIVPLQQACLQA